jgi:hypothetical protein
MTGQDRFERNRQLVEQRLDGELEAGTDFVEDRLTDLVSGPAAFLVNPAAKLVYKWIGEKAVKRRTRTQLELVGDLARDLDEASPEELVDEHLDELLETEEIAVRGRTSHDRFDEARDRIRDLLVQRLRILGTLIREGEGETYPELVRSVFDRSEVEPVIEQHFRETRDLVDLASSNPSLLPVPPGFRDPLWTLVGDTVDWYESRMEDQLDDIFGTAGPPAADATDGRASATGT